jgi:hypothetical protein
MTDPDELEIEVYCVTDYAEAFAELLERAVNQLLCGVCPEDIGREVELIGRAMKRMP